MQRINQSDFLKTIKLEHNHRYIWTSQFCKGKTLDIACGTGYGSFFITKNKNVLSYDGIDSSIKAIKKAKEKYSKPNVIFQKGSINNIKAKDKYYDTVISLETIEHTINPEKSLDEILRVLTPNGVFIGSVPTIDFEELSESVYGPNSYHLQKFSKGRLLSLLKTRFKHTHLFLSSFSIGTLINGIDTKNSSISLLKKDKKEYGSYVFYCTNSSQSIFYPKNSFYYYGNSLVEYDKEKVIPLIKALKKAEKLVLERNKYIKKLELSVILAEKLVLEKNEYINKVESSVIERNDYIKKLEERLL